MQEECCQAQGGSSDPGALPECHGSGLLLTGLAFSSRRDWPVGGRALALEIAEARRALGAPALCPGAVPKYAFSDSATVTQHHYCLDSRR